MYILFCLFLPAAAQPPVDALRELERTGRICYLRYVSKQAKQASFFNNFISKETEVVVSKKKRETVGV